MRRLNETIGTDAVSELLRPLRIQSTVWCVSELSAPWGFGIAPRAVSCFHLVLRGGGWLEVDGEQRRLAAGDLVVLAHGDAHAVRDDPATPVSMLEDLLAVAPPSAGRLHVGGGGELTEILCGGFVVEGRPTNPLLAVVPRVLHVDGGTQWLADAAALLRRELPAFAPGADAVVTRITDLLVTQTLRELLARRLAEPPVVDEWIAGVVRMINERPEHPWTLDELAAAAALSRTSFAARFRGLTGEAPLRYVARLRLSVAAGLLRDSELDLGEIAQRCGYESASSLSRAFRRMFGTSPGRYRRDARDAVDLLQSQSAAPSLG